MIAISGMDPLHDEAMKSHEQNEKDYEAAMKENKDAVNLVSGDGTKKKNEKVKKSSGLKKMHLSESLFEDMFDSLDGEELEESLGKDDLKSDIYNALADVVFKYRNNNNITQEDIEQAIEWFEIHFFEDEDLDENLDLNEGADFLDKVAEKVVGSMSEDLNEAFDEEEGDSSGNFFQLAKDVASLIMKEYPKGNVDDYNIDDIDGQYFRIDFDIEGDWKHDHLAFKLWMDQNAEELTDCTVKYGGESEVDKSDSDFYEAIHTYYFIPKKDEKINEPEENVEMSDDTDVSDEEVKEGSFDEDSIELGESLKFNIAKEQLKRFNECKMPKDWSPYTYLENLVNRKHITEAQKTHLEETLLSK